MRKSMLRIMLVAVAAAVVSPFLASEASAQVTAADAQPFIGQWSLPIQADQTINFEIDIMDHDGHVMASVGAAGTKSDVQQITKNGESLVLRYTASMQGQQFPVRITLAPNGETLRASLDAADGMFTANGTATKR
jgi:hypothetical protein